MSEGGEELDFQKDVMQSDEVRDAANACADISRQIERSIKDGQTTDEVRKLQDQLYTANRKYLDAIKSKLEKFVTKEEFDAIMSTITPESIENKILDNPPEGSPAQKFKNLVCDEPLSQTKKWIENANKKYKQGWFDKTKDKISDKFGSSFVEFLGILIKWAAVGGLGYWLLKTIQNEETGCYQYDLVRGGSPLQVGNGLCTQQTCLCPMKKDDSNPPCASPPCYDGQGKQLYNYNWQSPTLFDTVCNMLRTVTQTLGGGLDDILEPFKKYFLWAGIALLAIIVFFFAYKIIMLFLDRRSSGFKFMFHSKRKRIRK